MVVPPAAAAPRIADAEELAPMQLFQQYVEARSMSPEVWLCSLRLTSRQATKHPPKRRYTEARGPLLKVFRVSMTVRQGHKWMPSDLTAALRPQSPSRSTKLHFVQSSTRSRRLSRLCRFTACEGVCSRSDETAIRLASRSPGTSTRRSCLNPEGKCRLDTDATGVLCS